MYESMHHVYFCRKILKAVNYLISFNTIRFLKFLDDKEYPSKIGRRELLVGIFLLFDWLMTSTPEEV